MKYLTTILFALLATFALAQGDMPPVYWATVTLANELDAEMAECPAVLEWPHYCFVYDLDQDWFKMSIESLVRGFSDLDWATPWERDGSAIGRALLKTSKPRAVYGIHAREWVGAQTMVWVVDMSDLLED